MGNHTPIQWATGERSGKVSIGFHELCLYACGPDRQAGEPVAVIIQGLASSNKGWAAVRRLLKPFIRTYSYDRTGYGQSDLSSQIPSSGQIVDELILLLRNAKIDPPYIFVAHSWGGILSREFIHLRPDDVAGLVLIDANQERLLQVLDWRDPNLLALSKNLDRFEVTGLSRKHKLTAAEWQEYQDEERSPKHKRQAAAEWPEYPKSFPVLGAKRQLNRNPPLLGNRPVCVIMGRARVEYEKLYEAGVEAGNGSEQERQIYRTYLETWDEKARELQMEQLSLSRKNRFVVAEESGHNVQLSQPELIAEGVKWVLNEISNSLSDLGVRLEPSKEGSLPRL
jgi:pimeloyl-ACP methyl ester carboxylesterase